VVAGIEGGKVGKGPAPRQSVQPGIEPKRHGACRRIERPLGNGRIEPGCPPELAIGGGQNFARERRSQRSGDVRLLEKIGSRVVASRGGKRMRHCCGGFRIGDRCGREHAQYLVNYQTRRNFREIAARYRCSVDAIRTSEYVNTRISLNYNS